MTKFNECNKINNWNSEAEALTDIVRRFLNAATAKSFTKREVEKLINFQYYYYEGNVSESFLTEICELINQSRDIRVTGWKYKVKSKK